MATERQVEAADGGCHQAAWLIHDSSLYALQKDRLRKTTDNDLKGSVAPNVLK